ncbi:MAG: hypothetical protein PHH77_03390 [Victivallaceae bacterium]|nr:hypothetical protein [Victivallaceae bacterium]
MKVVEFNQVKVEFNPAELAVKLHLNPEMPEYFEFSDLLEAIAPQARPGALLAETAVIGKTPRGVISSRGEFSCTLLAELTDASGMVFPFIATCGKPLDSFAAGISDPLQQYWVDCLKEWALEIAVKQVRAAVMSRCPGRKISSLVPIDDGIWKLDGLKEIFGVFPADALGRLGVELTEYLFMKPNKSRAGIFFPAENEVDRCSLCKLKKCSNCPVAREE